jgi:CheY-like chemotaxis protein
MEDIGRLTGGVAHDFNNLLTVILGYCDLLLGDLEADDSRRADILEVQKAGNSAAGLTRQLLAFSRKESAHLTRLDLNLVVSEMRGMLQRLIREDVAVVLDVEDGPAWVKADRGQVEQILVNMAVNAQDAMPDGGRLSIAVRTLVADGTAEALQAGSYAVLTVTDTGTGMTPEVKARLFEPFFTTKAVGKGTGLGMSTVHSAVASLGGTVDVESTKGQGTSFDVYFPSADVEDTPAPQPAAPTGLGSRRGATVLVVEDADALRELTRKFLTRHGYTVLAASSMSEALDLFDRHTGVDLLLTDVVMPGGGGPELAGQLLRRSPGLPVIYMSGYAADAVSEDGALAPEGSFLHKPFTSDALYTMVQAALEV